MKPRIWQGLGCGVSQVRLFEVLKIVFQIRPQIVENEVFQCYRTKCFQKLERIFRQDEKEWPTLFREWGNECGLWRTEVEKLSDPAMEKTKAMLSWQKVGVLTFIDKVFRCSAMQPSSLSRGLSRSSRCH